jgi:hypothetical protein
MPATEVERGLMLFLAVLVEIGAALGIYFATGHMRPALQRRDDDPRNKGTAAIEAAAAESAHRNSGPLKHIAAPAGQPRPRRVPRLQTQLRQGG